jgi:GTP-binding protein
VQKLQERKADILDMRPSGGGRTRHGVPRPTRGLIGYQAELLSDTRGTAILNRVFHGYEPAQGPDPGPPYRRADVDGQGEAVAYALFNLEDRGPMMIDPGTKVYPGMIIGEHTRDNDLEVNVLKGKKLTNIRSAGKDDAVKLTTPIRLTLEAALSYIADDELVEVTPDSHPPAQGRTRPARAQARRTRHEKRKRLSFLVSKWYEFEKPGSQDPGFFVFSVSVWIPA